MKNVNVNRVIVMKSLFKNNLFISIFLGILFWVVCFFIYCFFDSLYDLAVIILLPLIIGTSLYFLLTDVSKKEILFYCIVVIAVREVILNGKALIILYKNSGELFIWDSIYASIHIGSIQLIFLLLGYVFAHTVHKKGGQKGN